MNSWYLLDAVATCDSSIAIPANITTRMCIFSIEIVLSHFRLTLSNTDRLSRRNKRGFYFDFFLKPTQRLLTHTRLCLLTGGSLKYGRPVPVTRNRSRSSSLPKLIRKREEKKETISFGERIFDEYRDTSLIIFRGICCSLYFLF